jgi:hypothetical protein
MAQTAVDAVDWLENELSKYDIHKPISLSNWDTLKQLVAQAKAIQKEQIEKAFNEGMLNSVDYFGNGVDEAEQYYNETYKK